MKRTVRLLAPAVLVIAVGCSRNNGWGDVRDQALRYCERSYDATQRSRLPTQKEWAWFRDYPKGAFLSTCADTVTPFVTLCTEFKFGTDSAQSCAERRVVPALQVSLFEVCAQHSPDDFSRRFCAATAASIRRGDGPLQ